MLNNQYLHINQSNHTAVTFTQQDEKENLQCEG